MEDRRLDEPLLRDLSTQLDRRTLLSRGLALAVGALPAASLLAGCGDDHGMIDRLPDWMMSGGHMMDPRMMEDMRVIHQLLQRHDEIRRDVEDVATGIRARTTSRDGHVAELTREHVWQMKARIENGDPIRLMDPVFREIFRHHAEVEMDIEQIPGGVLVVETSSNPQVELLIRQHARREGPVVA